MSNLDELKQEAEGFRQSSVDLYVKSWNTHQEIIDESLSRQNTIRKRLLGVGVTESELNDMGIIIKE